MGSVAQAVVDFDEAVQAPWRPPLANDSVHRARLRAVPGPALEPGRVRAGGVTPGPSVHGRVGKEPGAADVRAAPALRLTRRARRLGVVLGLAIGVALGSWVGSIVSADGGGLQLAGESGVVVQQGDTLWSIAASVAGEADDIRAVIAQIRELNGLSDASLVPGQVLALP